MFLRYLRSVLRYQLDHATSVATFRCGRGQKSIVHPTKEGVEVFHSTRYQGDVVCGSFRCGAGVPDPSGEHIRRAHLV